jgi:hypothetical protein
MADKIRWGIDMPHPFWQMKTELIWEGKYDEHGKRWILQDALCHFKGSRRLIKLPPVL